MTYAVSATWTALPGHEQAVERILTELAALTRGEPGNRYYLASRSVDDHAVFFLFEVYDDEAAYQAHQESAHFLRLASADAIPNHLVSRERRFGRPVGQTAPAS